MVTNYYSKYNIKLQFQNLCNRLFSPFKANNVQLSAIASLNDEPFKPTPLLLDIAVRAVREAVSVDLSDISHREKGSIKYAEIFPGEHYKLIAGLMKVLQPAIVIEIGTHVGLASLTIKKFLQPTGYIYTFDVIPWNQFQETCFIEHDFDDKKLVQYSDDLTKFDLVIKHKEIIENADFIFIDAMKDGIQEKQFLENFGKLKLKENCIVMFDDIRLWNMLRIWREIKRPKFDLTSFGHWSGTGLVHWNGII